MTRSVVGSVLFIFFSVAVYMPSAVICSNAYAGGIVTETCSEVAGKVFHNGSLSSKSDLLKGFQGKQVRWSGKLVRLDQTLWGVEAGVRCSPGPGRVEATVSFDESAKQEISNYEKGRQLNFSGKLEGCNEGEGIIIRNARIWTGIENPYKTNRLSEYSVAPPPQMLNNNAIINYESDATPLVIEMINHALDKERLSEAESKLLQLEKPQRGDKSRAHQLNTEAVDLMKQSKDIMALPLLELAHRRDPADVEITNNLASAYLNTGVSNNDFTKAKAMLVETLKLSPSRAIAWANLAYAFALEGNKYAATNCYINFCRFSKNRKIALNSIGQRMNDSNPTLSAAAGDAYKYMASSMPINNNVNAQNNLYAAMTEFIANYFKANENKDMDKVLSYYGDMICYYTNGIVSKSYIIKDKTTFFRAWRSLSYTMRNDLRIVKIGDSGTVRLIFTFDYSMITAKKTINGTVEDTWDVENAGSNPRIVYEKQKVIKRQSF